MSYGDDFNPPINDLPSRKLLDYLSTQRDFNIAILNELKIINTTVDKKQRQTDLTNGVISTYSMIGGDNGIAMDTGVTDKPFMIDGDNLSCASDSFWHLDNVFIRFNRLDSPAVPIKYFNPWSGQFYKIFLTFQATAGAHLFLIAGHGISTPPTINNVDARLFNYISNPVVYENNPLLANATYTSPIQYWYNDNARIVGSCYSDVSGTLYIDQSGDGTNYDAVTSIAYTGGTVVPVSVERVCVQNRIRYVNGGVNQTAFRLYLRNRAV